MTKVWEILVFLGVCSLIIFGLYGLELENSCQLPLFRLYQSPKLTACGQFSKRQWVRLLDIFVLGPLGLYIGYKIWSGKTEDLGRYFGLLIIIYGILTIAYNGGNYIANIEKS